MTFIGEQEGQAFRNKITNVFTKITIKKNINKGESGKSFSKFKKDITEIIEEENENLWKETYMESSGENKKNLFKIASGVSISELSSNTIKSAQENFQKEVGPEFGFDLTKIHKFYILFLLNYIVKLIHFNEIYNKSINDNYLY